MGGRVLCASSLESLQFAWCSELGLALCLVQCAVCSLLGAVSTTEQPGCRHAASTSPVLGWTPAGRLRGYFCFFIKAVGLKAAGDGLNTRKDWDPIYSVSTASSAGLVWSSWLQVTLGMVATTTSVHSTSPFSCGN